MIKIDCIDYWDVPRMFFIWYKEKYFLFDSKFDSEKDDYCNYYDIYLVPNTVREVFDRLSINPYFMSEIFEGAFKRFYEDIPLKISQKHGTAAIASIQFDSSRKEIDPAILDQYI